VARLAHALRHCRIDGVQTNLNLLLAVVETPAFRAGQLETGFLAEYGLLGRLDDVPTEVIAAAAAADFLLPSAAPDPWQQIRPWRLARERQPSRWRFGGREHQALVSFEPASAGWQVEVDLGVARHEVAWLGLEHERAGSVRVDAATARVEDLLGERQVGFAERTYRLVRAAGPSVDALGHGSAQGVGPSGSLIAPMPGRVIAISVAVGDAVDGGQTLAVLEAMKMEHAIGAPHAGVVKRVDVAIGQQVTRGERLLELEDETA